MKEWKQAPKRHRSHRRSQNFFQARRHYWDLRLATPRRTALLGFVIGLALGCLLGALITFLPRVNNPPTEMVDVNATTGRAQFHAQGKPDIK